MPRLFIRTCNSDFHSVDEGAHYEQADDALSSGIAGAVDIVRDEIQEGQRTAAVEVCIESEDGKRLLRSVVALSVSSLSVAAASPDFG